MSPQRFAVSVAVLCGTLVINGSSGSSQVAVETPRSAAIATDDIAKDSIAKDRAGGISDAGRIGAALPDPDETMPPAPPPVRIALVTTPDPTPGDVEAAALPAEGTETGSGSAALPDPHEKLPAATPPAAPALASAPDPGPDAVEPSASPVDAARIESAGAAVPDSREMPPPATSRAPLVSLFRVEPPEEELKLPVRPAETPNECLVAEICIDDYLWALYEWTPKVDTNRMKERIKATIKKKGKTRTVIRTITKYIVGDFTWKDPIAAQRAGMSVKDYVIGGMDRGFKLKLYHALRAMENAGLMPGITSAFRDDYRQSIASGNKAASDSSYHGGSRRGGYGHGFAADLVSLRGETRLQRFASSIELWKWIDAHEKELGIGRPYLNRDPPHVAPVDGEEYAVKRGGAKTKLARPATSGPRPVAARGNPSALKPAAKAGSGSI